MTATTTTLADFLLARIAEDEAVARAVVDDMPRWDFPSWEGQHDQDSWSPAERMALRMSPARVLAECEAKRRIVEWHSEHEDCCEERYGRMVYDAEPELSAGTDASGDLTIRQSIGFEPYLGCVTLTHLAAVYADHPDYRPEWRL